METWEYTTIVQASTGAAALVEMLNNGGAKGWELVGFTDSDPTFGANTLVAIMKRPMVPFNPPSDLTSGWKPDPSERYAKRYYDGEDWTFSVSTAGRESRDPPTMRSPSNRYQ